MNTVFVHFYAGPGVGKSTTNALAFGTLKKRGRNVEMIHEYAKERAWEGTLHLMDQREAAAEQMVRASRLDGKVEAALSDSSILLGLVYGQSHPGVTPEFKRWLTSEYKRMNTLNILLRRDPDRVYQADGRSQRTLEEAQKADEAILRMLSETGTNHYVFDTDSIDKICDLIESHINIPCPRCSDTEHPGCDPLSEGVPSPCMLCRGARVINR